MLKRSLISFYVFDSSSVTSKRTVPSPSSVRNMLMKQRQKTYNNKSQNNNNNNPNYYSSLIPPTSLSSQQQDRRLWSQSYDPDTGEKLQRFEKHPMLKNPARRPFVGNSIEDYTKRYWCVKFTYMNNVHENREMQRYVSWYAIKCKVVYLDYLPFVGNKIKSEIERRMHGKKEEGRGRLVVPGSEEAATLPALFVNNKLVGNLATLRTLEESGRLKDVLQFGFLWHSRPDMAPDVSPEALPLPPSLYGDEAMFRGQYRGAPVATPVVELPKYMPRDSIAYGKATGDLKSVNTGGRRLK